MGLWLGMMTGCAATGVGTTGDEASAGHAQLDAAADDRPAAMDCDAGGGVRNVARLPAGACAAASACNLPVWHPCVCAKEHAGIDGYECRCVDGSWRCDRTAVGATACRLDSDCRDLFVDAARSD